MQAIRIEMNESRGYYPVMTLATEDVLEAAHSRYGEEQAGKLTPYLAAACNRVAGKWESGDDFGVAVDWALEQALDYASVDGVLIVEDS